MPQQFLTDDIKVTRIMNAVAAGTSVQTSSAVNMAGYDGVLFIALLGTLTASQETSLKAQQSSDDGSADAYGDLEGTLVGPMGDDDDNKCLMLDIYRPEKQYLKALLNRATANAVIDGIIAIQYSARSRPVAQATAAGIAFSEKHATPAEGTA
jgi:hypothetical protein